MNANYLKILLKYEDRISINIKIIKFLIIRKKNTIWLI